MLNILIRKELQSILHSPKFPATFAVCSLLIILSVMIGIREYRVAIRQYEAGRQITDEQLQRRINWSSSPTRVLREPDPLQIFVSGVTFDLGRWSYVSTRQAAHLLHSVYSEDPVFAVFRFMDFSFTVLVVLSLFAIVFTYDAISGEREAGTLRLVFSHPIPRARYLFAKCVGAWLGLIIPLLIPILIGLLLLQLFSVPFTGSDWARLIALLGVALLYLTFFVVLGIFMSSLTKRSVISFLLSLMVWVLFVFIVPRIGIAAAEQVVRVPSYGEIESQRSAYERDQWQEYPAYFSKALDEFYREHSNPSLQEEMAFQDSIQSEVMKTIQKYEWKLLDDRNRAQREQQRLAFALCRFSPASAFQLAAMSLANTDIELKQRYEEAINRYQVTFAAYFKSKQIDPPGTDRITIMSDGSGMLKASFPSSAKVDLSDLPRFLLPDWPVGAALGQIAVDAGLLVCLIFAVFTGSWIAFMRYDLR